MRPRPADQAGFTLIELLVALALTALLALALSAGIATARRGWDAVAAAGDDTAPAVLALVRRQLGLALPLQPEKVGFTGGPDWVAFLAPSPSPALDGVLYRQRLERRDDGLWLSWSPLDGGPGHERRLLSGLKAVELAYWDEGGWRSAWDDPKRLPLLVRLRLVPADSRRGWPDLMAGPVVGWPVRPQP